MTQTYRYSIQDINNIILNGFEYKLDEQIIEVISKLTSEVGSPTYIKTPNFQKQNAEVDENKRQNSKTINNKMAKNNLDDGTINRRKKTNRNSEFIKDDDWETIRTFSTTKIEQHEGIDIIIDTIRSDLNKMSINP